MDEKNKSDLEEYNNPKWDEGNTLVAVLALLYGFALVFTIYIPLVGMFSK